MDNARERMAADETTGRPGDGDLSRRRLLRIAAYAVPAVVTMNVALARRALAHSAPDCTKTPERPQACEWPSQAPSWWPSNWPWPPWP